MAPIPVYGKGPVAYHVYSPESPHTLKLIAALLAKSDDDAKRYWQDNFGWNHGAVIILPANSRQGSATVYS